MSQAEPRADTDLERLYREAAEMRELVTKLTEAVNDLSANIYWLLDMAKPLLEMLNSPMFGAMAPGLMSAASGSLGKAMGGNGG